MINRHITRTTDLVMRFSWRFWLVCCCTGWLVTYQMVTWHELAMARAFTSHVMRSGLPPILLINPAPADAPTRVAPGLQPHEFVGPTEYFQYMHERMSHNQVTNTSGRTR